jgi:hypothetical protein
MYGDVAVMCLYVGEVAPLCLRRCCSYVFVCVGMLFICVFVSGEVASVFLYVERLLFCFLHVWRLLLCVLCGEVVLVCFCVWRSCSYVFLCVGMLLMCDFVCGKVALECLCVRGGCYYVFVCGGGC